MSAEEEKLLDEARAIYKGIHLLALQKEKAYWERNQMVNAFAKLAYNQGWPVWMGAHEPAPGETDWDPEWLHVLYVQLPSGEQTSWHLHDKEAAEFSWVPRFSVGQKPAPKWDGHTTDTKYVRLQQIPIVKRVDNTDLTIGFVAGVRQVPDATTVNGVYTVTARKWPDDPKE